MVQITKDNAYDAVAPDDFPAMLEVERYSHRNTAFDKIISATHDHFWDPLDKKYIDFAAPFDLTAKTIMPMGFFPIFSTRIGDAMSEADKIKFANEASRWQISSILHGEQGALALSASLCHIPEGSGRAGICRQPDTRRSTACHGVCRLHQVALGHADTVRRDASEHADRDRQCAGGLQEDRRHADAGRRPRHGCVRHALSEIAGSAAGETLPACDDRRSLPPQIRKDLGRPHDSEALGRGAQHRRGLGGAVFSDAAVQPRQCRTDADGVYQRRYRLAGRARRDHGSLYGRRPPRGP